MTFGEKLKVLRKEQGYSQEDLAQQLDVTRQAVSKWESDRGMPETEKLLQISTIFGVTLDYMLKEEYVEDSQNTGGYYVSREMIDGFLSYKRLGAKRIAVGVGLIILSNIFVCIPSYRQLTMVCYWIMMAIGFAILVWHFFQPKRYQEIGKKILIFDEAIIKAFRAEHERSRRIYVFMITVGVIILILGSQISLLVGYYAGSDAENGISWILNTVWVDLFILSGLMLHAEHMIAQNTSYMSEKNKKGRFVWLYVALPVTGIAELIALFTNAWSPLIPIVILLCFLLVTVCKLLIEGRSPK
jgi:Predicted transcriptional regulators